MLLETSGKGVYEKGNEYHYARVWILSNQLLTHQADKKFRKHDHFSSEY